MAIAESPYAGVPRNRGIDAPLVVSQEGSRTVVTLRSEAGARAAADLADALAAAVVACDGDVVVALGATGPLDPCVVAVLAQARLALRSRSLTRELLVRAPSTAAPHPLDGPIASAVPARTPD